MEYFHSYSGGGRSCESRADQSKNWRSGVLPDKEAQRRTKKRTEIRISVTPPVRARPDEKRFPYSPFGLEEKADKNKFFRWTRVETIPNKVAEVMRAENRLLRLWHRKKSLEDERDNILETFSNQKGPKMRDDMLSEISEKIERIDKISEGLLRNVSFLVSLVPFICVDMKSSNLAAGPCPSIRDFVAENIEIPMRSFYLYPVSLVFKEPCPDSVPTSYRLHLGSVFCFRDVKQTILHRALRGFEGKENEIHKAQGTGFNCPQLIMNTEDFPESVTKKSIMGFLDVLSVLYLRNLDPSLQFNQIYRSLTEEQKLASSFLGFPSYVNKNSVL